MKEKEVTIEKLARMVKKGFDETLKVTAKQVDVDRRFEHVDRRFEHVDRRFDNIEERLDRIENIMLKQHAAEIELLKRRIQRIEETFAIK